MRSLITTLLQNHRLKEGYPDPQSYFAAPLIVHHWACRDSRLGCPAAQVYRAADFLTSMTAPTLAMSVALSARYLW